MKDKPFQDFRNKLFEIKLKWTYVHNSMAVAYILAWVSALIRAIGSSGGIEAAEEHFIDDTQGDVALSTYSMQ